MAADHIPIQIGNAHFDLADVGNWIDVHWALATVLVLVAFIFWVTRPKGFGSEILRAWSAKQELDRKREKDTQKLIEKLENRPPEAQLKLKIDVSRRKDDRRRKP